MTAWARPRSSGGTSRRRRWSRSSKTEVADRRAAADAYQRAGQAERAGRLRAEADVLSSYLGGLGGPAPEAAAGNGDVEPAVVGPLLGDVVGGRGQAPWKFGGRFSRKAVTPSMWSLVWPAATWAAGLTGERPGQVDRQVVAEQRLGAGEGQGRARGQGGHHRLGLAAQSSSGQTRLTSPNWSARSASTQSPSRAISSSLDRPTSRGRCQVEPASGIRAMPEKASRQRAALLASRRSQAGASDTPARPRPR